MMTVIVDTNVALVASRKAPQASGECVGTCINWLEKITNGQVKLALDDERRIIDEYRNKLSTTGQPGIGDAFLKWVETRWTNEEHCDRVSITPIGGSVTEFEEFPTDSELEKFDRDDRKFIAVALAHPEQPPILQATDTQWWDFRDALSRHGVTVEFICKDDIQRLHDGD